MKHIFRNTQKKSEIFYVHLCGVLSRNFIALETCVFGECGIYELNVIGFLQKNFL